MPHIAIADDKAPDIRYSAIQTGAGGVYAYVPDKWGIVHLVVVNPLDTPHDLLSTTYFDGALTLQFARRVWVPARARLHTWQPVLAPTANEQGRFEISSLVIDGHDHGEVLTREDSGQMLHKAILPASLEVPVTGFIEGMDDASDADSTWAYDLVVACRINLRLSRKVTQLRDHFFAPDDASLQPLDQLVIADSRVLEDHAGLAAIRRWVHAGGRLWVMLDRVDPKVLEIILGDEFVCQVVDRVGLTTVKIEASANRGPEPEPVETEYEQPVDLVRVLAPGAQLAYTVNGWPAAFATSFGAGKVLVTTLAPRGWVRVKTAQGAAPSNAGRRERVSPLASLNDVSQSPFVPLPPMAELALGFFQRDNARTGIPQTLESRAGEYVGYSIPPRGLVVGLLCGFVAFVFVIGLWLMRRQALEHLGWVSPGLAVGMTAALLIIGGRNRHAIPSTAATVEFVEAIPGTDDTRARGAIAFYNPESSPAAIAATRGGRLVPDMTGLEGTTRRMVWTDLDSWTWEHVTFDGGQRLAQFRQSETLPDRIEARGAFGPDGLAGHLSAEGFTGRSDALIATRQGRVGLEFEPDGGFRASAASVFAPDQYLAAGLVSDEQDRRRRTYAQILPGLFREDWSGPPLVLFWAERRTSRFQFDEGRRLVGSSLVAVPLILERPQAGTAVHISAPFLPFRNTFQPDGTLSSSLWDSRRLEWQERNTPGSAWLKFQLPRELLPIELTRARLVVQVSGPVGRFEVSGLRRGRGEYFAGSDRPDVVSVKTWHDPVGTLAVEISDQELLRTSEDGGFMLGIAAGDPDRPELTASQGAAGSKANYWKIEHLSIDLVGVVGQ